MKESKDKGKKWRSFFSTRSCNFSRCVTISTALCLLIAFVLTLLITSNPYPAHASCEITWKFTNSCSVIFMAIKGQIEDWEGPENCNNGGQKCLYKIVSETNSTIEATHTTPVNHYVDDLIFNFTSPDGMPECTILGYSSSRLWYAVLDYGTNYCNLHNLITGSGLDRNPGYTETTQDSQCTQYSKADCQKY